MSDISTTSYCQSNKCDQGNSSIFMILILLMLCGGDSGIFGCGGSSSSCGCGSGFDGILPMILLLCLCGGSF